MIWHSTNWPQERLPDSFHWSIWHHQLVRLPLPSTFPSQFLASTAYAYLFPATWIFIYFMCCRPHRARAHNHTFSRASSRMAWNKPIKCITGWTLNTLSRFCRVFVRLGDAHIWLNENLLYSLLYFHRRPSTRSNWEMVSGMFYRSRIGRVVSVVVPLSSCPLCTVHLTRWKPESAQPHRKVLCPIAVDSCDARH